MAMIKTQFLQIVQIFFVENYEPYGYL